MDKYAEKNVKFENEKKKHIQSFNTGKIGKKVRIIKRMQEKDDVMDEKRQILKIKSTNQIKKIDKYTEKKVNLRIR